MLKTYQNDMIFLNTKLSIWTKEITSDGDSLDRSHKLSIFEI